MSSYTTESLDDVGRAAVKVPAINFFRDSDGKRDVAGETPAAIRAMRLRYLAHLSGLNNFAASQDKSRFDELVQLMEDFANHRVTHDAAGGSVGPRSCKKKKLAAANPPVQPKAGRPKKGRFKSSTEVSGKKGSKKPKSK